MPWCTALSASARALAGQRFNTADNDGGLTATGADIFAREPAFGCFTARLANGSTGFDFMLAAFHARWEGGNTTAIKNEVRNVPQVFQAMRQARPGEEDLITWETST